jgi:hypothetical protein
MDVPEGEKEGLVFCKTCKYLKLFHVGNCLYDSKCMKNIVNQCFITDYITYGKCTNYTGHCDWYEEKESLLTKIKNFIWGGTQLHK